MTTSVHVVKKSNVIYKKLFNRIYPHIVIPKKGFEKTKPTFSSK